MKTQLSDNLATSYRVLHMTNKASFPEMPDYHLIVDYASQNDLDSAFLKMKNEYKKEPHLTLMQMVSTFRVAFSSDETESD